MVAIFKINYKILISIGAAVKCIHTYSLIYNDLPWMNDEKIREENFLHMISLENQQWYL